MIKHSSRRFNPNFVTVVQRSHQTKRENPPPTTLPHHTDKEAQCGKTDSGDELPSDDVAVITTAHTYPCRFQCYCFRFDAPNATAPCWFALTMRQIAARANPLNPANGVCRARPNGASLEGSSRESALPLLQKRATRGPCPNPCPVLNELQPSTVLLFSNYVDPMSDQQQRPCTCCAMSRLNPSGLQKLWASAGHRETAVSELEVTRLKEQGTCINSMQCKLVNIFCHDIDVVAMVV